MELTYFQSTILAFVQGLTEFLPISSSAHLILPRVFFDWPEQGVAFDVMVHLGSLAAVLWYFRQDIYQLFSAWCWSFKQIAKQEFEWSGASSAHPQERHAILAWLLILATIPAGLVGLLWQDQIVEFGRNGTVIAISSIVFGLILFGADYFGQKQKTLDSIGWQAALAVGVAQVFALIPGTSRSGVTMSAALLLGFDRVAATRFSFLLAIPIIAASSALEIGILFNLGASGELWMQLLTALLTAGIVAYMCIHWFLKLIAQLGFLPFVIYRIILGIAILAMGVA